MSGLSNFLDNASFPVLSANLHANGDPRVEGKVQRSHIFSVNGEKIGVIGYTAKDTPSLSLTGEKKKRPFPGACVCGHDQNVFQIIYKYI